MLGGWSEVGDGHGLDESGVDEFVQRRCRDTDEPADLDEADAALSDQSAREAFGGGEQFGGLGDGEKPVVVGQVAVSLRDLARLSRPRHAV